METFKLRTIRLDSSFWTALNWPKIEKATRKLSSNFFDVIVSLLSSVDSSPSFTAMPYLVLEKCNSFIRDLTTNAEIERNLTELCPPKSGLSY